jgi:hypothetical protein
MLRIGKKGLLSLLLICALAPSAQAQTSFAPGVGGIVAREDVQGAFGWNDRYFRSQGEKVTFTYETTDWYTVACRAETAEGTMAETATTVTRSMTFEVVSMPRYESAGEGRRELSGYDLLGFREGEKVQGSIPPIGHRCMVRDGAGRVTRTELERVRDRLYANFGKVRVGIWVEAHGDP